MARNTEPRLDPAHSRSLRRPYPWRYFGLDQVYLSATLIILGEFLLPGSRGLALYWAVWFLGANLFVIKYEEPALRRRFGPAYQRYVQRVGRWLPRSRSAD